jgi:hypothetical protein
VIQQFPQPIELIGMLLRDIRMLGRILAEIEQRVDG